MNQIGASDASKSDYAYATHGIRSSTYAIPKGMSGRQRKNKRNSIRRAIMRCIRHNIILSLTYHVITWQLSKAYVHKICPILSDMWYCHWRSMVIDIIDGQWRQWPLTSSLSSVNPILASDSEVLRLHNLHPIPPDSRMGSTLSMTVNVVDVNDGRWLQRRHWHEFICVDPKENI